MWPPQRVSAWGESHFKGTLPLKSRVRFFSTRTCSWQSGPWPLCGATCGHLIPGENHRGPGCSWLRASVSALGKATGHRNSGIGALPCDQQRAAFAPIGASRRPTQATSRWRLVFVASAARFRMREIPFRRHAAAEMPCALFHYTRIAIRSAIPMRNYPNPIPGCSGTPGCAERGPGCLKLGTLGSTWRNAAYCRHPYAAETPFFLSFFFFRASCAYTGP